MSEYLKPLKTNLKSIIIILIPPVSYIFTVIAMSIFNIHEATSKDYYSVLPFQTFFIFSLSFISYIGIKHLFKSETSYFENINKNTLAATAAVFIPITGLLHKFYQFIVKNNGFSVLDGDDFMSFSILSLLGTLTSAVLMKQKIENHSKNLYEWNDDKILDELIKQGENIILIQTWYPDAARISDFFNKIENYYSQKNIKIFLLSPLSVAAYKRYKKIYTDIHNLPHTNSDKLNHSEKDNLHKLQSIHYIASLENFIQRFDSNNKFNIEIYNYNIDKDIVLHKIYISDKKQMFTSEYKKSSSTTGIAKKILHKDVTNIEQKKSPTQLENELVKEWYSKLNFIKEVEQNSNLVYAKKSHNDGKIEEQYHSFLNYDYSNQYK